MTLLLLYRFHRNTLLCLLLLSTSYKEEPSFATLPKKKIYFILYVVKYRGNEELRRPLGIERPNLNVVSPWRTIDRILPTFIPGEAVSKPVRVPGPDAKEFPRLCSLKTGVRAYKKGGSPSTSGPIHYSL